MKELLLKIIVFFALLVLIKLPFSFFYRSEINFREAEFAKDDYTAVFVGSSRTKMSIIPAHFDELVQHQTKSYNAGVDSGLPPQTLDWCAEQIKKHPSLKYLFVELSGESYNFSGNEDAWQTFSFFHYRTVITRMSFEKSEKYHDKLAINLLKPLVSTELPDFNHPLAEVWKAGEIGNESTTSPEVLKLSRLRNIRINTNQTKLSDINRLYLERIERLITIAESNNIRIFFFVPPRLKSEEEAAVVAAIYSQLPEKNRLTTDHADESLYQVEVSTDDTHLNRTGAKIFSEMIAGAFRKVNNGEW